MPEAASVPTTQLLAWMGGTEEEVMWAALDARYRPLIAAVAARLGLDPASAEDVAQETLLQLSRDLRAGKFDRGRGRLRSWMIGIARHRVIDAHRSNGARRAWRGSSAVEHVPTEAEVSRIWLDERRDTVLREALDALRSGTGVNDQSFRVFEMIATQRRSAPEVSAALGIKTEQVYVIKSRMTARLREEVERLTALYED